MEWPLCLLSLSLCVACTDNNMTLPISCRRTRLPSLPPASQYHPLWFVDGRKRKRKKERKKERETDRQICRASQTLALSLPFFFLPFFIPNLYSYIFFLRRWVQSRPPPPPPSSDISANEKRFTKSTRKLVLLMASDSQMRQASAKTADDIAFLFLYLRRWWRRHSQLYGPSLDYFQMNVQMNGRHKWKPTDIGMDLPVPCSCACSWRPKRRRLNDARRTRQNSTAHVQAKREEKQMNHYYDDHHYSVRDTKRMRNTRMKGKKSKKEREKENKHNRKEMIHRLLLHYLNLSTWNELLLLLIY